MAVTLAVLVNGDCNTADGCAVDFAQTLGVFASCSDLTTGDGQNAATGLNARCTSDLTAVDGQSTNLGIVDGSAAETIGSCFDFATVDNDLGVAVVNHVINRAVTGDCVRCGGDLAAVHGQSGLLLGSALAEDCNTEALGLDNCALADYDVSTIGDAHCVCGILQSTLLEVQRSLIASHANSTSDSASGVQGNLDLGILIYCHLVVRVDGIVACRSNDIGSAVDGNVAVVAAQSEELVVVGVAQSAVQDHIGNGQVGVVLDQNLNLLLALVQTSGDGTILQGNVVIHKNLEAVGLIADAVVHGTNGGIRNSVGVAAEVDGQILVDLNAFAGVVLQQDDLGTFLCVLNGLCQSRVVGGADLGNIVGQSNRSIIKGNCILIHVKVHVLTRLAKKLDIISLSLGAF